MLGSQLVVNGPFEPANVIALAHRLKISPSLMFMSCPGAQFPYSVAEFGTRIIALWRWHLQTYFSFFYAINKDRHTVYDQHEHGCPTIRSTISLAISRSGNNIVENYNTLWVAPGMLYFWTWGVWEGVVDATSGTTRWTLYLRTGFNVMHLQTVESTRVPSPNSQTAISPVTKIVRIFGGLWLFSCLTDKRTSEVLLCGLKMVIKPMY